MEEVGGNKRKGKGREEIEKEGSEERKRERREEGSERRGKEKR